MSNSADSTKKVKATYYYKLFRVRRKNGKVTTVSIDPILVTRACQVVNGGLNSVRKLVVDAAANFEPEMFKNCSGYCSEQLRQAVDKARGERHSQQRQAVAA